VYILFFYVIHCLSSCVKDNKIMWLRVVLGLRVQAYIKAYNTRLLASGSSGSTSGTGIAFPLTPILTPGDPLTEGDVSAATASVSSSDESVSCDSVVASELTKWDSISWGWALDPLEGSLPPSASALGPLSDRLIIGWERFDIAGVEEILRLIPNVNPSRSRHSLQAKAYHRCPSGQLTINCFLKLDLTDFANNC